MSFNYTPPPAEVEQAGQLWTYVLYAWTIFIPNVKAGAAVAGLGSGAITFWVTSYAKGDMGGLSHMIGPPIQATIGAAVGAALSFVSLSLWRGVAKLRARNSAPEPETEPATLPGSE